MHMTAAFYRMLNTRFSFFVCVLFPPLLVARQTPIGLLGVGRPIGRAPLGYSSPLTRPQPGGEVLVLVEAEVGCARPPRSEEAQGRLGQSGIQVARPERLQVAEGSEGCGFLRFGPQKGLPRGSPLGRRYGPILSPSQACGSEALIAFTLQSIGCLTFQALPCRSGLAFLCLEETTSVCHWGCLHN